jgi:hypothetical protein
LCCILWLCYTHLLVLLLFYELLRILCINNYDLYEQRQYFLFSYLCAILFLFIVWMRWPGDRTMLTWSVIKILPCSWFWVKASIFHYDVSISSSLHICILYLHLLKVLKSWASILFIFWCVHMIFLFYSIHMLFALMVFQMFDQPCNPMMYHLVIIIFLSLVNNFWDMFMTLSVWEWFCHD